VLRITQKCEAASGDALSSQTGHFRRFASIIAKHNCDNWPVTTDACLSNKEKEHSNIFRRYYLHLILDAGTLLVEQLEGQSWKKTELCLHGTQSVSSFDVNSVCVNLSYKKSISQITQIYDNPHSKQTSATIVLSESCDRTHITYRWHKTR